MARLRLTLAAVSLLAYLSFTQAQTCYFPDGQTESPQDVPCNSSATASPCCNKANMCMENGLCLIDGIMSRGSCTDKNWGPACANFCKNEGMSGGISLFPCSAYGGIFSCAWGNCDSQFPINGGNGVVLRPSQVSELGLPGATVSAADVLQVANATSTSSSAATSTSATNESGARYTAGDMAGVGAGVGVPLLLALIGALFLLWRERKSGRKRQQAAQSYEPIHQQQPPQQSMAYNSYSPAVNGSSGGAYSQYKQPGQHFHEELDTTNNSQVGEMEGSRERQELPAQGIK